MQEDLETRRRRARWRAGHRGTKELDLLLGGFANAHLDSLDGARLSAFEALLAMEEPVLQRWLLEAVMPDDVAPSVTASVVAVRAFHGLSIDHDPGNG